MDQEELEEEKEKKSDGSCEEEGGFLDVEEYRKRGGSGVV